MTLQEMDAPALGVEERRDEAPGAGASHARPTPDPEVVAKPKRRKFTAQYRLRILEEAESCTQPGEVGRLLRREGLYSSHLTEWRPSCPVRSRPDALPAPPSSAPAKVPHPDRYQIALPTVFQEVIRPVAKPAPAVAPTTGWPAGKCGVKSFRWPCGRGAFRRQPGVFKGAYNHYLMPASGRGRLGGWEISIGQTLCSAWVCLRSARGFPGPQSVEFWQW